MAAHSKAKDKLSVRCVCGLCYECEVRYLDRSKPIYFSNETYRFESCTTTVALYEQADGSFKLHVIIKELVYGKGEAFVETILPGAELKFLTEELLFWQAAERPN